MRSGNDHINGMRKLIYREISSVDGENLSDGEVIIDDGEDHRVDIGE
jgi:hypothetical protein